MEEQRVKGILLVHFRWQRWYWMAWGRNNELWIDDNIKGGSQGLFEAIFPEFVWKYLEKLHKYPVKIPINLVKTWTCYLLNTSLEYCHCISPCGKKCKEKPEVVPLQYYKMYACVFIEGHNATFSCKKLVQWLRKIVAVLHVWCTVLFFQVIFSRVSSPEAGQRQELENLLDDRFYVPVLRSEDNSVQATVGEPFSPACPLVGNNLFFHEYLYTNIATM
jgi:hypothetical protein